MGWTKIVGAPKLKFAEPRWISLGCVRLGWLVCRSYGSAGICWGRLGCNWLVLAGLDWTLLGSAGTNLAKQKQAWA